MRYELSGVETNNKGAELMLYAILQEIERKDKEAVVYLPNYGIKQGLDYIKTNVDIRNNPYIEFIKIGRRLRLTRIFYILNASRLLIDGATPLKSIDYFIDASGFRFSDQFSFNKLGISLLKKKLYGYHKKNTKIIFLPQAFGPIKRPETREALSVISDYSSLIMPREVVSQQYLQEAGVDMEKVQMFPDFTSLVPGIFPNNFEHLSNGICIIPNEKMIAKKIISFDNYISLILKIIKNVQGKGYPVYLLNHEGIGDERIAIQCKQALNNNIEVITGLNALEVKGLIASAYLCISSRFHGVASALNSAVPCLATSWSHKYKELFNNYEISDGILPITDINACIEKIIILLDTRSNKNMREHLKIQVAKIKSLTRSMWKKIWE